MHTMQGIKRSNGYGRNGRTPLKQGGTKKMTPEDKIKYIRDTRATVMSAAEKIISARMKEYAENFGWDQVIDSWLWDGMGDCGTGYLIAVGNSTNTARVKKTKKTDADFEEKRQKYIGCRRAIEEGECPGVCSECEYGISQDDFSFMFSHCWRYD